MKVVLTLTPGQADILLAALDTYSRLHMGQFWVVTDLFPGRAFDRSAARAALQTARQIVMPDLDFRGYYGIKSREVAESARIAWDVQQVLRHGLAWHRHPVGGFGVCYDTPSRSAGEPLPEVRIEGGD
jgi:hypothetical protein